VKNGFKCGVVAIAGRPNVGKSTFLNCIMGSKLAIVTPKPQTTRDRILGIFSNDDAQILFHDTPGIHQSSKAMNQRMVARAVEALDDADVVLMMTDAVRPSFASHEDAPIIKLVRESNKPAVLVINKVDQIDKPLLLPIMQTYMKEGGFSAVVPISAKKGQGVNDVISELIRYLPEGEPLYPEDELSDRPMRFLASEIIREKVTLYTHQEVPYSTAVTIDQWVDGKGGNATKIDATIHVERDSQKAIVIGAGGAMLKRIGTEARKDIEEMAQTRVMLKLNVITEENWTESEKNLARLLG
jgi:GTP-binding protein Era